MDAGKDGMKTIAVASMKGGSGKSTTALHLAAGLARAGRRALLIDLDPQANLTTWTQTPDPGQAPLEMLAGARPLAALVTATATPGLDFCPASDALIFAPEELARTRNPDGQLADRLRDFAAAAGAGAPAFVILDTPPGFGILTRNALAAAGAVIVPTCAHFLNVSGLVGFMANLEKVRAHLNPALTVAGILLTRVDRRTRHAGEVADLIREHYGRDVYRTEIRENVRLAESVSFGKTVFDYAPDSHGAEDYAALAREVTRREGGQA